MTTTEARALRQKIRALQAEYRGTPPPTKKDRMRRRLLKDAVRLLRGLAFDVLYLAKCIDDCTITFEDSEDAFRDLLVKYKLRTIR